MKSFKPENPHVDNTDSWREDTKHLHGLGEPKTLNQEQLQRIIDDKKYASEIEAIMNNYEPLTDEEAQIINDITAFEEELKQGETDATVIFTLGHQIESLKKIADMHKSQYDNFMAEYAKLAANYD